MDAMSMNARGMVLWDEALGTGPWVQRTQFQSATRAHMCTRLKSLCQAAMPRHSQTNRILNRILIVHMHNLCTCSHMRVVCALCRL